MLCVGLSGEAEIEVDGTTMVLGQRDLVALPAGTEFSMFNPGDADATFACYVERGTQPGDDTIDEHERSGLS
jgi:mannose-6-phosphate isomerase-like protein (cupin superfamily)